MAIAKNANKKTIKTTKTKPSTKQPLSKFETKKEIEPTTKTTTKTTVSKTNKTADTKKPTTKQSAKTELKGKFAYYKTSKSNINFRLKAPNNETIAVSGGAGYTTLSACKAGIESVRKNANSPAEDQTLKIKTTLANPKFEIFCDKAGKFRYRLLARNGELLCSSEGGYSSKEGCKKGIESLAKWALNSDIVNDDK